MNKRETKKKQAAIVLATSESAAEAYQKLHPDASPASVKANAWRLLADPGIQAEVNKLVAANLGFQINKQTLVTLLSIIITGGLEGKESTKDMLEAIKVLTKLVPEFNEKADVSVTYERAPEAELDAEIKRLSEKLNGRASQN